MDHYLDIRLRPDPEFPAPLLMNALFAKLHRALVGHAAGDVGVSFPDHQKSHLGSRLRLHGRADALAALMAQEWLTGMRDHIEQGPIAHVPAGAAHRCVRRVQADSSPERLRRRLEKRHGMDTQTALMKVPDSAGKRLALPYVSLKSQSTGQVFRLFVEHGPLQAAVPGAFGTYGLSANVTVPWF